MSQRKCSFLAALFVFSLSVAIYAISFFLPTFEIVVDGKPSFSYGYEAFSIGFLSPFLSPFCGGLRTFLPWLANPLYWFGVVGFVTHQYRRACFVGVIATATSTTLWIFNDPESRTLFLIGYFLWVLSIGLVTLATKIKCV
jgi:hypothetical protein